MSFRYTGLTADLKMWLYSAETMPWATLMEQEKNLSVQGLGLQSAVSVVDHRRCMSDSTKKRPAAWSERDFGVAIIAASSAPPAAASFAAALMALKP